MAKAIQTKPSRGKSRARGESRAGGARPAKSAKSRAKGGKSKAKPTKRGGPNAPKKSPKPETAAKQKLTRAESSRNNGSKSKGPKSLIGKCHSRLNAVKHGLTAKIAVLPEEDAGKYHERLEAWTADLKPANPAEAYWVTELVKASWKRDRLDRVETARLNIKINNASIEQQRREEDEALALGQLLFADPRGPATLFPTLRQRAQYDKEREPATSFSAIPDDPNTPERLVLRLTFTSAGCRWLIRRWKDLRDVFAYVGSWQSPDKFKAIRLLGRQPLDVADNFLVRQIFAACHMMNPTNDDMFADAFAELSAGEARTLRKRLDARNVDHLLPADEETARELLDDVIRWHLNRLEETLAEHERRAAKNAVLEKDALAFDASREGDVLRRYELSLGRAMFRMVDTIGKVRKVCEERADADLSEFMPPGASDLTAHDRPTPTTHEVPTPTAPEAPAPTPLEVQAPIPTRRASEGATQETENQAQNGNKARQQKLRNEPESAPSRKENSHAGHQNHSDDQAGKETPEKRASELKLPESRNEAAAVPEWAKPGEERQRRDGAWPVKRSASTLKRKKRQNKAVVQKQVTQTSDWDQRSQVVAPSSEAERVEACRRAWFDLEPAERDRLLAGVIRDKARKQPAREEPVEVKPARPDPRSLATSATSDVASPRSDVPAAELARVPATSPESVANSATGEDPSEIKLRPGERHLRVRIGIPPPLGGGVPPENYESLPQLEIPPPAVLYNLTGVTVERLRMAIRGECPLSVEQYDALEPLFTPQEWRQWFWKVHCYGDWMRTGKKAASGKR
jgi:hypothetical protein